jgi:voltage-gated potassium channel
VPPPPAPPPERRWLVRLRRVVEERDTRAGFAFDLAIKLLILLSLVGFAVETLPGLPAGTRRVLAAAEWLTVAVFTVEYGLRVLVARPRRAFVFSWMGLVDLVAILPAYLPGGVDLRSLRVVRLIRALKLVRHSRAIERYRRAFVAIRSELAVFLSACLVLVYFASVGIYYFEREAQPEAFASVFHAMWWAIVTLTTLGYGDVVPITAGGRLFTTAILFVGLGVVAVPAGLVASALTAVLREEGRMPDGSVDAPPDDGPPPT